MGRLDQNRTPSDGPNTGSNRGSELHAGSTGVTVTPVRKRSYANHRTAIGAEADAQRSSAWLREVCACRKQAGYKLRQELSLETQRARAMRLPGESGFC